MHCHLPLKAARRNAVANLKSLGADKPNAIDGDGTEY